MPARENLTMQADINIAAREIDFVSRFQRNWEHLRTILGIMRPIRVQPGTVLKSVVATVNLESGSVGEGEEIPYSKANVTEKDYEPVTIEKYSKATTIEAIQKHGAFLGSLIAVSRVIRCNPYNPGGYDPVPDKFSLRGNRGRKNEPSVCEKCEKKAECSGEDCSLLEQSQNKGE